MNGAITDAVDTALAAQQVVIRDAAEQAESVVRELARPVGQDAWVGAARTAYDNAMGGLRSALTRAALSLRTAESETAMARLLLGQVAIGAVGGAAGRVPGVAAHGR